MRQTLIILTKFPKPGKVKTRLAKSIGKKKAADFQIKILDKLLDNISKYENKNTKSGILKIYLKPYTKSEDFCNIFNLNKEQVYPQPQVNLGKTMSLVFKNELKNNKKVALIGSDTPNINKEILSGAYNKLDSNDVVLGPSTDGGYYLVAMQKKHTQIFKNIRWSHQQTLNDTLRQAKKYDITFHLLPELTDIDTIKDLNKITN